MKNPIPKTHPHSFVPYVYPMISKKILTRNFVRRELNFLDVLLSRRSSKEFAPISIRKLSELLFLSCKVRVIQKDNSGYLTSKRSAPSAGARHPIDVLISLPTTLNKRTLDYYNPVEHSLNELSLSNSLLHNFFIEVNQNIRIRNACVIWFSIQTGKTTSKYENAESLYWRDAGALLYCIQIVACYLNLKSCPLGTLATNSFKGLLNSNSLLPGGGILIGR